MSYDIFSLLGQRHCCEKKRGFPEERSFIGHKRAVSGCCVAHDKKDERGDTERLVADAEMDANTSKCGLKEGIQMWPNTTLQRFFKTAPV